MTMTDTVLRVRSLNPEISIRDKAYEALKQAITEMDIYGHAGELRFDERQLSKRLGVSRTPVREAMTLLEQEGLVRSVPRRGIFIIRKTKREIVEMIQGWAALEGMAARLATDRATEEELESLKGLFAAFEDRRPSEHVSEYSDANLAFHRQILRMGRNKYIIDTTDALFIHLRAIRRLTIGQGGRAERSIIDHRNIIRALEARDGNLAERLVREHTLGLAAHVEAHGDFLR
ncbi:GntR family transcriptional regulator [Azospirillum sp. SYSU D00513]|uniref:GntR family transcriptional regulator n=1 Tax=Azospirillum sp. SYSU D00513 TaxID=2812561 RepID=UPI001FFF739E|nr:GntR family transcriptional regulator [Azospirillum sp. SYSU D00513]